MNIEEKIALSSRPNIITFINEGLFMRCYNQSAFIVTGLLGIPFKLTVVRIKKLSDEPIIYCGVPSSKVHDYFQNLTPTVFGFEMAGVFNVAYYEVWLKQKIAVA